VKQIAALFVQHDGVYFGLENVDPWDEERDAREYCGPHPVVAHPPCQRWGSLWAGQPLWIKRTGQRKRKGDDGGCFAAALHAVWRYGGVLEHPWSSHAWPWFGLTKPPRAGGWTKAGELGGWTCCVEQGRYGHYAPKPTLLYVVGCCEEELPELDWGVRKVDDAAFPEQALERYGLKRCRKLGLVALRGGGKNSTERIRTPLEFRDLLLNIAATCRGQERYLNH